LFPLVVLIAYASVALSEFQYKSFSPLGKIHQRFEALRARSNAATVSSWFQQAECGVASASQLWNYFPLNVCVPFDDPPGSSVLNVADTSSFTTYNYSSSDCTGTRGTIIQPVQSLTSCSTSFNGLTGGIVSSITGVTGNKNFANSAACIADTPVTISLSAGGCTADSGGKSSFIQTCTSNSVTVQTFPQSTICSGASDVQTFTGSNLTKLGYVTSCSEVKNTTSQFFYCNIATPTPSSAPVSSSPSSAPVSSSSSSSSKECFAGSETVQLKSGETKFISEVMVGDNVLAYNPSSRSFLYSEVVSIPHAPNSQRTTFVHLETLEGMSVKMTPEHLLPSGVCGSSFFPLLKSGEVQLGSCVQTMNGEQKIVSKTREQGQGIYTIVTGEEYVVVNGIVASPFAVSHYVPNTFYNFHRLAYKAFPESMKTIAFDLVSAFAAFFSAVSH